MATPIKRDLPSVEVLISGKFLFSDDMPVWFGQYGDDVWPFRKKGHPLYKGEATSAIVWYDYIHGKGSKFGRKRAGLNKYIYCLTEEMVADLKIAAIVQALYPQLLKSSKSNKAQKDGATVVATTDELAKLFSMIRSDPTLSMGKDVIRFSDVSYPMLKAAVAKFPGRGGALKRALKILSAPVVQKHISTPLAWSSIDIEKGNLPWNEPPPYVGYEPLSDEQFLFILNHCMPLIVTFKNRFGLAIHDEACKEIVVQDSPMKPSEYHGALDWYYELASCNESYDHVEGAYGIKFGDLWDLISDGHIAAILIIFLFTGMRISDSKFLMQGCLKEENGYWFLKSKVVKDHPKEEPAVEGWLAIDLTRDAYDVLNYLCGHTRNNYLFGSVAAKKVSGLALQSPAHKINLWIQRRDQDGIFRNYRVSDHQYRETLVNQLAKQNLAIEFITIQLKHFQGMFDSLPNPVSAKYGNYCNELRTAVSRRMATVRFEMIEDYFGEGKKFAGGGGEKHLEKLDAFFTGAALSGERRKAYLKNLAEKSGRLMFTSIGLCGFNFSQPVDKNSPPCYGDYQCDPDCHSHVIPESAVPLLEGRIRSAKDEETKSSSSEVRMIFYGLRTKLQKHLDKLLPGDTHGH